MPSAATGRRVWSTAFTATHGPRNATLGALQAYQNMPEPGPEAARRAAARSVACLRTRRPQAHPRHRRSDREELNSLGVSAYEHIANWTAAGHRAHQPVLDFKGRIERENWVEQARILGAGGETEFSRRVDRGEVESSRPKE